MQQRSRAARRSADRTAASRQGRRHVGAYVPPDVARQLRIIAAREDSSTQRLIEEAIEMSRWPCCS